MVRVPEDGHGHQADLGGEFEDGLEVLSVGVLRDHHLAGVVPPDEAGEPGGRGTSGSTGLTRSLGELRQPVAKIAFSRALADLRPDVLLELRFRQRLITRSAATARGCRWWSDGGDRPSWNFFSSKSGRSACSSRASIPSAPAVWPATVGDVVARHGFPVIAARIMICEPSTPIRIDGDVRDVCATLPSSGWSPDPVRRSRDPPARKCAARRPFGQFSLVRRAGLQRRPDALIRPCSRRRRRGRNAGARRSSFTVRSRLAHSWRPRPGPGCTPRGCRRRRSGRPASAPARTPNRPHQTVANGPVGAVVDIDGADLADLVPDCQKKTIQRFLSRS